MIVGAPDFASAVRNMVQFLEKHFERVMERAALYRTMHNSGVVDDRRDHAWAMHERVVGALAEQLGKTGPKDTEDLESLARMMMGVSSELRYAMIQTGKPTPAHAARLVTRFLQGAHRRVLDLPPALRQPVQRRMARVLDREAETNNGRGTRPSRSAGKAVGASPSRGSLRAARSAPRNVMRRSCWQAVLACNACAPADFDSSIAVMIASRIWNGLRAAE